MGTEGGGDAGRQRGFLKPFAYFEVLPWVGLVVTFVTIPSTLSYEQWKFLWENPGGRQAGQP